MVNPRLSLSSKPFLIYLLLVTLLLAGFWIALAGLQRDSLWTDEAWTAWAVQPPYLRDTLEWVRGDVHPPLYFLLLNLWGRAEGDSVFALRVPSALVAIIGLAVTYAVGKRLFDWQAGIFAVIILATASLFVYYTREARMYMLLLALAALSMGLYLRWRDRPSWWRTLLYALSMASMLYTHYAGALIIATQIIHLGLTGLIPKNPAQKRLRYFIGLLIPYLLALILFAPWLPIFLTQMKANPNGPLAIPVPTNWATVAALVLILTSASWGWYVLPFVVGSAIPRIRQHTSAIILLLLWFLLTPITLLALNAWVTPVYQVRYSIAMLPAGALLLAYGLRFVTLPESIFRRISYRQYLRVGLPLMLLIAIVIVQLTIYPELWESKPPWETTIRQMTAARQPLEPTITDIAPYSPVAYYDRHLHIRQGIGLDLSWRLHSAEEVRHLVTFFQSEPSVWVALPVNTAKTWHIISELDKTRHVGYRSSLINMIFYRFDAGNSDDLQFRFGDLLRYERGPGADRQFTVQAGADLCVDVALKALNVVDGSYSAGLHLVDLSGTTNAAAWDGGVGTVDSGQTIDLASCLTVPVDTAPGYYHLELVVYNWSNLQRLPVIEDGGGDGLPWQDVLMLAAVDVAAK